MSCFGNSGETGSRGFGSGHQGLVQGQDTFHSRAVGIEVFVQMNFGDAVVVQANGLADGILRNFESAIQISPEGRFKIKPNRETENVRSQAFKEIGSVRGLMYDGREMFSHRVFVVAADGREYSSTVDCGILMVDAGGQRQDDEEFLRLQGIAAQIRPILVSGSSLGSLRRAREQH